MVFISISRIIEVYNSLIQTFKRLNEDEDDAAALGYFIKLTDFSLLSTLLFMNDILLPFFKADKLLQENMLSVTQGLDRLNKLKTEIDFMYTEDDDYGFWLGSFKKEFEEKNTFQGIEIQKNGNISFESIRSKLLDYKKKLLEFLTVRLKLFEEYAVFKVLDFKLLNDKKEDWRKDRNNYKDNEVIDLLKFYNNHVPPQETINEKILLEEWFSIKAYLVHSCIHASNEEIYKEICYLDLAENFIKIIRFYLTIPISNAPIERGFSLMNLIKDEVRSRMNDDLLGALLAIKFNGTNPQSIPYDSKFFQETEEHWRNAKVRRFI